MSVEKSNDEGLRWLSTAVDDLQTARILRDNSKFAQCCFYSQQAAEKAIKAVFYNADQEPWGHSIYKLIQQLDENGLSIESLRACIEKAKRLDQYYIPTRYPNGLPGTTPAESYSRDDAEFGIKAADEIITIVRVRIGLHDGER
jgi:HEPN domain-containing protein